MLFSPVLVLTANFKSFVWPIYDDKMGKVTLWKNFSFVLILAQVLHRALLPNLYTIHPHPSSSKGSFLNICLFALSFQDFFYIFLLIFLGSDNRK